MAVNAALVPEPEPGRSAHGRSEALVESYRRLAAVFHEVLSEQSPEALLDRIADTLGDLVPHQDLHIYEADEQQRELVPVFALGPWTEEVMASAIPYGQGITGWAVAHRSPVLANEAHLDPRVEFVPGTPPDPEALISVPLIARGSLKGALNIYRIGEDAFFDHDEFELARWFGDAAALAIDNAQIRARLEHLAHTDSLTGLYNHRYFHERLRSELSRAGRAHDTVALMMLDIDDFKRVNDVCGHAEGDEVLQAIASLLRKTFRASDVVCRVGGEEFAVILPGCSTEAAVATAERLTAGLGGISADAGGQITLSVGVALGPEHAMNARELFACAEAAMMTAKAQGKDRVVVFEDLHAERPLDGDGARDLRSIAHLKLLQSLAQKLGRLNDVTQIGEAIVDELRMLVDYHNCIVYLLEGRRLLPVAVRGQLESVGYDRLEFQLGEGLTGHVAETGKPMLVANVLESDLCKQLTEGAGDESLASVPLRHGQRVDRGDHDVEARRRPVRRRRPAAARGRRRPCVGRARERAALRVGPPRGRERHRLARVLRRCLRGALGRGYRRADRFDDRQRDGGRAGVDLDRGRRGGQLPLPRVARVRRRSASRQLCPGCGRAGRTPCA